MQPFEDQSALLESLAASCASWSQPISQPIAAAQVLTPPELANASSLEAICANLVGVLGAVQPPPPTPACPPNPATPTVQLPKSPPTPPWKKTRTDAAGADAAGADADGASMNVDSGQNPWAQNPRRDDDWGAANAACERLPRFGPVPGETPAEAIVRKERNRETKNAAANTRASSIIVTAKAKEAKVVVTEAAEAAVVLARRFGDE